MSRAQRQTRGRRDFEGERSARRAGGDRAGEREREIYIYIYTHTYIHTYIHTCIYIYRNILCVRVCVRVRVCAYMCVYTHQEIYLCVCVCVCLCVGVQLTSQFQTHIFGTPSCTWSHGHRQLRSFVLTIRSLEFGGLHRPLKSGNPVGTCQPHIASGWTMLLELDKTPLHNFL